MEFTLLGAVLIAAIAMYLVLRWEAGRTNAADCTRDLWDGLLTAGVVGLAVGRVASMLLDGTNPLANPADLLIVRSGVNTAAASISALATFGWVMRKDIWWMADAGAPAVLAGLAGWHAGCLARDSACLGTPSDLPWAMSQAGSSVSRHPVEIYAAVLLALGAIALVAWKRSRRPSPGVVGGAGLALASIARLLTEPMRPSLGAGPVWLYAGGVAAGAVIIALRRRAAINR